MAQYYYEAFSKQGKKITGVVDAVSTEEVRGQLIRQGNYPTLIRLVAEGIPQAFTLKQLFEKRVTVKEKVLFTKQLSVLLKSGVPLVQALELLSEQFDGRMKSIIVSIKDGIKEGKSLAQGLHNYPKVFDNIYVQLVRAGEASGKLEVILERLTLYLERREEINKKVKAAMRGPLIQLVVVVLVVFFLMTKVVPGMAQTFIEQKATLPASTQLLLSLSDFIKKFYIIVVVFLVGMFIAFKYWAASPAGALTIDKIKLNVPIIKYFSKTNAIVQFCQTLGMLVEGGVNLAEALDIVVNIVQNRVLTQSLKDARDKIIKEGKIAPYLKQTGLFPPMAIYLINTGEQSGKLGFMLQTVAQNYEVDLMESSENLTVIIQPIMLLFMAVVVGFIVLAIMQPIMALGQLTTF